MQNLLHKTNSALISDRSNQGFTLIELIASLVLLGILTAVFGLGIVGALNIYAVSEENVHLAQKGQIALSRINRELLELTGVISHDDPTYIIYRNLRSNDGHSEGLHAIAFDSDNNRLLLYSDLPSGTTNLDSIPESDADLLLDQVSAFRLVYHQGADDDPENTTNTWNGINQRYLSHIRVNLTMNRNGTIATNNEVFTSLVYLRNTINYGGAAPAVEPPTPPGMLNGTYVCFVTALIPDDGRCPPLIFLCIVLMMIPVIAGLAKYAGHGIHRLKRIRKQPSGSALIAVIVAILLFSTIAAALLPLVSSSGHQVVARDHSEKAYLMAESGFRYAAGRFVRAGSETAKFQTLRNLNNSFYQTEQGQFELKLYGYFFKVEGTVSIGDTSIATTAPGGVPPEIVNLASSSSLDLKMVSGTQILQVNGITISDDTVTFTLSSGTPVEISDDTLLYPAASPSGSQTLTNGGNITAATPTDMFPLHNGYISVAGRHLSYRYNNTADNQLVGVVDLNDPGMSLTITPSDDITLNRHVRLVSTGFYGSGDFRVNRTVTYDTPLPFNTNVEGQITFEDHFDDPAHGNWTDALGESDKTSDDGVLQVADTNIEAGNRGPIASLFTLDSESSDKFKLQAAHTYAGDYLSYDAQVKIGFIETSAPPLEGYIDNTPPVPSYFAAGISFRLFYNGSLHENNNYYSYGISFLRGNNSAGFADNIENELVPLNDQTAIVLWQRPTNYSFRRWLAYKIIEDETVLQEDFEDGTSGWEFQSPWHLSTNNPGSGSNAFYFGSEPANNYDLGDISGDLEFKGTDSTGILLPAGNKITLTFQSWHQTETSADRSNYLDFDQKLFAVRVYEDGEWGDYQVIAPEGYDAISQMPRNTWNTVTIDLSDYACQRIGFRFSFDTVDANYNAYEGWYIDDIAIKSDRWPVNDATLVLRLKEASVLEFTSSGNTPIEKGDVIHGTASHQQARVIQSPILKDAASWGDGVTGYLLLNNVSGSFSDDDNLYVNIDSLAEVNSYSDEKTNYIKVYYGAPDACGDGDNDPFNARIKAYPRETIPLIWPPELEDDGSMTWPADEDYFRLIQWDVINSHEPGLVVDSDVEPGAIIHHHYDQLQSPSGNFTSGHYELGLHTFGKGSKNIYFDDFGLRLQAPGTLIIPTPVQQ